jgi:uncharacterized membrane protein HdeD (DUF308 family)
MDMVREVWTRSRWWLSLRGLVAIVFAVLVVAWPDKDWFTLLSLYTGYALVDGIAIFMQATKGGAARRTDPWPLLVVAILGIAAGLATLYYWGARPDERTPDLPIVSPQFVVLFAWAIARGVYEITASVRLRKEIEGEWLLASAGTLSIVFAVLLAILFGARITPLIWATAVCLIAAGVLYLALSIRLTHLHKGSPHASGLAR